MTRNAPVSALGQNGRAGVDMLGAMQKFASNHVRRAARQQFEASAEAPALAAGAEGEDRASIMDWVDRARDVAARQALYRLERFTPAYVPLSLSAFGIPAVPRSRAPFAAGAV